MLNLTAPEMSCSHCVKAITAAVQALDAVAEFLRFRNLGVQVPSAPPENR